MTVRLATREDLDTVIELLNGLAEYEHASEPFAPDRDAFSEALFGLQPQAEVVLAETDAGESAGLALFFAKFNVWTAKPGVWLGELFVRPQFRGHGYGRALLAELAAVASARGGGRLEWSVFDWNEPAAQFYKGLGASPLDDRTTFRLSGDALTRLAAAPTSSPVRGE